MDRPTLIHFNDGLKEIAEARERKKTISSKPKTGDFPASTVKKTKTETVTDTV